MIYHTGRVCFIERARVCVHAHLHSAFCPGCWPGAACPGCSRCPRILPPPQGLQQPSASRSGTTGDTTAPSYLHARLRLFDRSNRLKTHVGRAYLFPRVHAAPPRHLDRAQKRKEETLADETGLGSRCGQSPCSGPPSGGNRRGSTSLRQRRVSNRAKSCRHETEKWDSSSCLLPLQFCPKIHTTQMPPWRYPHNWPECHFLSFRHEVRLLNHICIKRTDTGGAPEFEA